MHGSNIKEGEAQRTEGYRPLSRLVCDQPVGVLARNAQGEMLEMPGFDLCCDGLCLEMGRFTVSRLWPAGQPEPGAMLDLQLLLPRSWSQADIEVNVRVRVLDIIRLSERSYEVNVTFLELSPTSRSRLLAFLDVGELPMGAAH